MLKVLIIYRIQVNKKPFERKEEKNRKKIIPKRPHCSPHLPTGFNERRLGVLGIAGTAEAASLGGISKVSGPWVGVEAKQQNHQKLPSKHCKSTVNSLKPPYKQQKNHQRKQNSNLQQELSCGTLTMWRSPTCRAIGFFDQMAHISKKTMKEHLGQNRMGIFWYPSCGTKTSTLFDTGNYPLWGCWLFYS